jgi:hypothetical protein
MTGGFCTSVESGSRAGRLELRVPQCFVVDRSSQMAAQRSATAPHRQQPVTRMHPDGRRYKNLPIRADAALSQ